VKRNVDNQFRHCEGKAGDAPVSWLKHANAYP
jgi:hypothetical protein